jgi:hypothetical protein
MKKFLAAAALAAALCFGVNAGAQTLDAHATINYEPWTMSPIVTDGAVKGFLCWAKPDSLTGDNIPIIMCKREGRYAWTMWGWSQYDLGAAVNHIRLSYGDWSIFSQDPTLSAAVGPASPFVEPKEMENGLYFDDPAQGLVQEASNPEYIVESLVTIGWAAAPDLSPLASSIDVEYCDDTQVDEITAFLNKQAFRMEIALIGEVTAPEPCFQNGCFGCLRHYGPFVANPNSSWSNTGSGNVPGTTDKICYYQRAATQSWYEDGYTKIFCTPCTATGTTPGYVYDTRVVPQSQSCPSIP